MPPSANARQRRPAAQPSCATPRHRQQPQTRACRQCAHHAPDTVIAQLAQSYASACVNASRHVHDHSVKHADAIRDRPHSTKRDRNAAMVLTHMQCKPPNHSHTDLMTCRCAGKSATCDAADRGRSPGAGVAHRHRCRRRNCAPLPSVVWIHAHQASQHVEATADGTGFGA